MIESALNSLPSIASVGSVQVRLQDTSETLTLQVIFVPAVHSSHSQHQLSVLLYHVVQNACTTHVFELCWRLSHNQWSTIVLNSFFERYSRFSSRTDRQPRAMGCLQRVSATVRLNTICLVFPLVDCI